MSGRAVDAATHIRFHLLLGGLLELGRVHVADGHRPSLGHFHEAPQLVDVELGIGLLVEVEGNGGEAAADDVLEDGIGGAADVGGQAHLLGFEVIHELLVVRGNELPVVVRRHEADGGGGLGEAQAYLGLRDGIAPCLAEVRGDPHHVVNELRVLEGVEEHHLRIAKEHGDGPRPHRHRPHGRGRSGFHERLALLEEAGQPRGGIGVGHLDLGQARLVFQYVSLDRRHHVVGVLDLAPEGFGLLGEVVVGEHHVGLVALVVVHHGRDGLDRVRAVLLDGLAVEGAREGGHDRIDGHPVGEGALVGRHHAISVGERPLALLGVPQPIHFHVARGQLGLVLHELGDRVADAAIVRAAEPFDDLLHPAPRDGEGHFVILGLAEDAVAGAGQDDLRLTRLHGGDDDVGAHRAPLEG